MTTELCHLFAENFCDKTRVPNPLNWGHAYSSRYFELLNGRRATAKHVLEIGIGYPEGMGRWTSLYPEYRGGASLRAWRKFFPNATVCGVDKSPKAIKCISDDEGIKTFRMDATRKRPEIGSCEMILDDGSHMQDEQALSLQLYLPLLSDHGIYIIEDIDIRAIRPIRALAESIGLKVVEIHKGDFPDGWDNFIAMERA